jgi:hypothetical protein
MARWSGNRRSIYLLSSHQYSNDNLPKWLQLTNSTRRLGTKCLPYLILIIVGCIFQFNFSFIYKIILLIGLCFLTRGYMM